MMKLSKIPIANIKVYRGYGYANNIVIYGHAFRGKEFTRRGYSNNPILNIIHLIRSFFLKPLPGVPVRLCWEDQEYDSITESDGFFKFEWQLSAGISAGWHKVAVQLLTTERSVRASGTGQFYIPYTTQYAFVSDIDDTVLISHSATKIKRLLLLFTKNPHSRSAFEDVVHYYNLLSKNHQDPSVLNPFFYVSSSEWNLYDDLVEFFKYKGLPDGIFLLSEIKKWYQLLKSGKTKHQGKLLRVTRLLETYPSQQFILLGDNSQSDPDIYASIANRYPERIKAIYIRNIRPANKQSAEIVLNSLENKDVQFCIFENNSEAMAHSRSIGLIA